jgi:hypothetical protein
MTVADMHYRFKIGLDKVDSLSSPNFIPEEIDIFLNDAQDQFIAQRAFRNNHKREGVEETQKRTDDLRNIIDNFSTTTFTNNSDNKPNGVFITLPATYRHALQEEATVSYNDCTGTATTGNADVVPTSHDRYNKIKRDPFNEPDEETVYRMGFESDLFELVSEANVTITNYSLRYIRIPQTIRYGTQYQTPTTDVDCELSEHTHREIIALAVKNALEDIESPRYQSTKIELRDIE